MNTYYANVWQDADGNQECEYPFETREDADYLAKFFYGVSNIRRIGLLSVKEKRHEHS